MLFQVKLAQNQRLKYYCEYKHQHFGITAIALLTSSEHSIWHHRQHRHQRSEGGRGHSPLGHTLQRESHDNHYGNTKTLQWKSE